jgi:4-alpha-glucanotransferase
VPPDYFSSDGQLWGNPLYRWEVHASDGFAWWKDRLRASFEMYDIVRFDHFRGFDEYWRIPLPAANARTGEWRKGPGLGFFRAIREAFPASRIIAEDLGVMTLSVEDLLRDTGLPGMAVLQFAFGDGPRNAYLPHNLRRNCIVYPGTHDNDTTLGWYRTSGEAVRDHLRRYLRVSGAEAGWDLIRAAYTAVGRIAVIPLQDILGLGSEARLNLPGRPDGNWQWRLSEADIGRLVNGGTAAYLAELAGLAGRKPEAGELLVKAAPVP